MILTHTGFLGDFTPSLTIANYYWKKNKEKTKFVLTYDYFKKVVGIKEFLMLQDFVSDVVFDPYTPENYNAGGQPYKFVPESIQENEKYYNLGFWGWANEYLGKFYAKEHDLNCDLDVDVKFKQQDFPEELKNKKLYTLFAKERWDKEMYQIRFTPNSHPESLANQGFEPFDDTKPLLHNLNMAYYAEEIVCYPSGFSVVLDMCNIKHTMINGSTNPLVYYISENRNNPPQENSKEETPHSEEIAAKDTLKIIKKNEDFKTLEVKRARMEAMKRQTKK